ncbi:MAG: hypothetical protein N2653_08750 [Burkholderiales bacterium]|nr:hypothetical protein [Burkholderiales bacterium]
MRRRLAVSLAAAALAAAALAAAAPARSTEEADETRLFGAVLALVAQFVRAAAAPGPEAARRHVDEILAGRNSEANRAAGELFAELAKEVQPEHRGTLAAIAKDLLAIARREQARAPADVARERAIAARKELHAMGLRYWDEQQYREALARGDRIAVELFEAAGALRPGGR